MAFPRNITWTDDAGVPLRIIAFRRDIIIGADADYHHYYVGRLDAADQVTQIAGRLTAEEALNRAIHEPPHTCDACNALREAMDV